MMELSASRWAKPTQMDTPSQIKLDLIQNTPSVAQNTPSMIQNTPYESQNTQPKALTNGSASKLLKPGDPGFVNPYAKYVADLDPSGTMDDGRFYVGRNSHYVNQSPPRSTRGSNNRNRSFRPPQRHVPQPTPNTKPVFPSPTLSWAATSDRKLTPRANGKASKYSTAQPGREYQQSRWSGQSLATSSKLPEGFFRTAKGTSGTTVPPTTAPAAVPITATNTPKDTCHGNRGDGWEGSQGGEGRRDTRSKDGVSESHQRAQAAWKPRDKPLPAAEWAQAFFGTPKVVPARVPSPEAQSNWASKTDGLPQSLQGTSQVIQAETDRNGQGSVDQVKDHLGTSNWFTSPTFDQKDRPAQQPQPQAPPSSAGVRSGERGVVNEQERPPAQQPARPPESPRHSEEAIKPRDTASVPSRPASQGGDPLVIQYPVGDGCWVKMVVYVERDSKTAYSRLSGLGRRQISGIKVKTPEQLGDMVKDIVVDEKQNLIG